MDSVRLVQESLHIDGNHLIVGDEQFSLGSRRRLVVVGAGKAGAGMADGLEQVLGDRWLSDLNVRGWINVPADCVRKLRRIQLHAARPAGVNEPTSDGVLGAEQILKLVSELTPDDLCVCLISGGGSALLPAPVPGITLADKQAITKHLSSAGANIQELNCVRKQLSRIKGGGLARACQAGQLITLIISDVLGDPLDVIASGPTVADTASPSDALQVLQRFHAREAGISSSVFEYLEKANRQRRHTDAATCQVTNVVIGNNAVAVDAAGIEAERRGYSHAMIAARQLEGSAEEVGRHHAELAWSMRHEAGPDCLITGGEPTVQLVPAEQRGKGGRNQQLVLAALQHVLALHNQSNADRMGTPANIDSKTTGRVPSLPTAAADSVKQPFDGIALLSGGTDGEDGPTDAAGALVDQAVYEAMLRNGLDVESALRRNDAYHFFEPLGGLIKTGPTHTNVCDLRVVVTANRP